MPFSSCFARGVREGRVTPRSRRGATRSREVRRTRSRWVGHAAPVGGRGYAPAAFVTGHPTIWAVGRPKLLHAHTLLQTVVDTVEPACCKLAEDVEQAAPQQFDLSTLGSFPWARRLPQ